MRIAPIVLVVFVLCGCQAMIYGTASDLDGLRLGMNKEQVIKVMGSPVSTEMDGDKHEEQLIYKRMKHTISDWPRTYEVMLRDDKVVKWGEQYKEQNTNSF